MKRRPRPANPLHFFPADKRTWEIVASLTEIAAFLSAQSRTTQCHPPPWFKLANLTLFAEVLLDQKT